MEEGYDEVILYFDDGTNTTIWVSEDDEIEDAIVDICEEEGWDLDRVTGFCLVKKGDDGAFLRSMLVTR